MTSPDEIIHALPLAVADLAVGTGLYLEGFTALGSLVAGVGALLIGCLACQTLSHGRAALHRRFSRS